MLVSEVFGIKKEVMEGSYIDRGHLDDELSSYLRRDKHIAIRGESKSGKSWLRKKIVPEAIVVQCRLNGNKLDLYTDALSQLGIKFEVNCSAKHKISGKISANNSMGASLIAKLAADISLSGEFEKEKNYRNVGGDISDFRHIASIIKNSGKRLVIEDFHYLSIEERKVLAFDLKALWDYGVFVLIVGIWNKQNLLPYLNKDLTGRIVEINIHWKTEELARLIFKGCSNLNVNIARELVDHIVSISYGNVGILQEFILETLNKHGIRKKMMKKQEAGKKDLADEAALFYAEQLNALYQTLCENISTGMRRKENSTHIYLHALSVIVEMTDDKLMSGIHIDELYPIVHAREARINKGNLKQALLRLDRLQATEEDDRGVVFAYDDSDRVYLVDKQILLYRKYKTILWPWEQEDFL